MLSVMGSDCSKSSDLPSRPKKAYMPPSHIGFGASVSDSIRVESVQRDDLKAIYDINRELKENIHAFLLNNLIMSVHFFADHKE